MQPWSVPIAALIVSITALIFTAINGRRKASNDYVLVLEARIANQQTEIAALNEKVRVLEDHAARWQKDYLNLLDLMRKGGLSG